MSRCQQCNACQSQFHDEDCAVCGWPTVEIDLIDLIRERDALKADNIALVSELEELRNAVRDK